DELVWLAIDQLNENSLLENKVTPKFVGESRRDVIKKVGLASMIAIPLVASLVAPRSAMANVSCACFADLDCGLPAFSTCLSTVCCSMATGICQPAAPGGCTP